MYAASTDAAICSQNVWRDTTGSARPAVKLRYWHRIEGYIAHQVLWYVWNRLLWSLGNSGAIAIVGGRLKVAQLDLASGNTPQLVQLNALPQVVPELLYPAVPLKSLRGMSERCASHSQSQLYSASDSA